MTYLLSVVLHNGFREFSETMKMVLLKSKKLFSSFIKLGIECFLLRRVSTDWEGGKLYNHSNYISSHYRLVDNYTI